MYGDSVSGMIIQGAEVRPDIVRVNPSFDEHYLNKRRGRRYLPVKMLLSLLLLDFQCEPRAKDALQRNSHRPTVTGK